MLLVFRILLTPKWQRLGPGEVKRARRRLEELVHSLIDIGMVPEVPFP